jgi:hypothetical protein
MYKFFGEAELIETNRMLRKFPGCLKIAFIDCEEKGSSAQVDAIHERQRRRYFSCLIDRDSTEEVGGRRRPHYSIELPGYPILGDGKSDNQNHAFPFMRGTFSQCIDANQGAYFEQMLLLPCVLGEFRSSHRGDGGSKKIIGLPEHITSDIGSVGDMAASAEVAFGTILQRTYAVLGARMHYGHPDIMNKHYMMQQGGVSKATKTLNLSEDIFTLRGQGREIKHARCILLKAGAANKWAIRGRSVQLRVEFSCISNYRLADMSRLSAVVEDKAPRWWVHMSVGAQNETGPHLEHYQFAGGANHTRWSLGDDGTSFFSRLRHA